MLGCENVLSGMAQLMCQSSYFIDVVVEAGEHIRMDTVDIRAEGAGALAAIFRVIDPSLVKGAIQHGYIVIAKNGKAVFNKIGGFGIGDF